MTQAEIFQERKELLDHLRELELRFETVKNEIALARIKLDNLPLEIKPDNRKLPFGNPAGCPKIYCQGKKLRENSAKLLVNPDDFC